MNELEALVKTEPIGGLLDALLKEHGLVKFMYEVSLTVSEKDFGLSNAIDRLKIHEVGDEN